ncbi:MAG TPA: GNAT family N-acetyltransferase [Azospirillaceae bacterium]|nr:GNAT family N-acetyltransferase [Azospirillaceae bacterium]
MSALETDRLRGTPLGPADLGDMRLIHADPTAMVTLTADGRPLAEAVTAERLDLFARHWAEHGFGPWGWRLRGGDFVGYCGLKRGPVDGGTEVELLYGLRPAYWRQGLVREAGRAVLAHARDALGLDSLVCFTLPTNRDSRRAMEGLGFAFERHIRHAGLPHVLYRLRLR